MSEVREQLRRYMDHLVDDDAVDAGWRARVDAEAVVVQNIHQRRDRRYWSVAMVAVAIAVTGIASLGLGVARNSDVASSPDLVTPPPRKPMGLAAGTWERVPTTLTGQTTSPVAVWTGSEVLTLWLSGTGSDDIVGEAWHPGTSRVRSLAPSGVDGRAGASVAWTGTEVLIAGGSSGPGIRAAIAAYNPASDSWRRLTSPPGFKSGKSEPQLGGPAVWTGQEMVIWRAALAFDPTANTWRRIAKAPLAQRMDEAVVAGDGKVYVWGGCDVDVRPSCDETIAGEELTDGAVYDPVADAWEKLPAAPLVPGDHPSAAWTGTELLVVVNVPAHRDPASVQVAAFNPRASTWRPLSSSPHPGGRYVATVWTGDKLALMGGLAGGEPIGAVTFFDPAADQWSQGVPGPARDRHDAVWAEDRLIVVGGWPDPAPWTLVRR